MAILEQRDVGWINSAPIQIRKMVKIAAPASAIWAQLAANEDWVDWFPGFRECRFTSAAPHGADSIRMVHQDQFKVTERITVWEPDQRWGMTVAEINIGVLASMAELVELSESDGQTTVTFNIGVELSRWGKVLRRPLVSKSTKGLEKALINLSSRVS